MIVPAVTLFLTLALFMVALVEYPRVVPCFLCGAAATGIGAIIYICGDEQGFLSPSYVGRIIADHDRMQATPVPQEYQKAWDDEADLMTPAQSVGFVLNNIVNEHADKAGDL